MLELFSPAKINLFLRVVSKRSDGYHNLSSVFQTLSLGDTLFIEPFDRDVLTCTDPMLPTDNANLALKATELFRRKTGLKHYFKIHLVKRIPTQAGLGGGSSNAASVLWACDVLANTKASLDTLKQWAIEIGSDIPFFFSQGSAYCTGRGESVYHLPALASRKVWIVKPACGLSTPEVYGRLKLSHEMSEKVMQQDLDTFLAGSMAYFNDLEKSAFEINPDLEKLKNKLLACGFETVLLSGSGSSFFCMGPGKPPVDPQLTIFPVQFIQRTLDQWYQS